MAEEAKERVVNVDIGGLHGRTFIKEARLHPEQQFVVIDPKAAPLPSEEVPPNLTYIKGQVEESGGGIPFPDAGVDRVLIEQVFDPLERKLWKPLFSEASRILKEGGKLEIIDLGRNRGEIRWSLPYYGFSQIESRRLKENEGSEVTKTLGQKPKVYSRPVLITAKKG